MATNRTIRVKGRPTLEKGTLDVTVRYKVKALKVIDTPFGVNLNLENAAATGEPGEPAFPVQRIRVALPPYSDVLDIKTKVTKTSKPIRHPVFVAPVQEMRPTLPVRLPIKKSLLRDSPQALSPPSYVGESPGITMPQLDKYRTTLAESTPVASIVDIEHQGPATVLLLEIQPVSQNSEGFIELATIIHILLSYEPVLTTRPGTFVGRRFYKQARHSAEAHKIAGSLKAEVINPNWIRDLSHLYPLSFIGCDYLIITDDKSWNADTITAGNSVGNLVEPFERLSAWKRRRGLRTRIVTITDIISGRYGAFATGARDLQEVLRNFLKWSYTEWNISWVLLGGDINIIPTRLVAGAKRGYISVNTVNPPEDNKSYWTGSSLQMHVVNPGEWWPGNTPHILVEPSTGTLIPHDTNGNSNASNPGWYYTTNDTYSIRTANRTHFVAVNGPASLINNKLQWLYQWNTLPTDLYYSSLVGPNYSLPGVHDWDLLDNGLYGQHTGGNNFDGVSFSADVGLGRAPVGNVTEAETFVDKVIAYEQLREPNGTPLNLNWPRCMTFVSTNFGGRIGILPTATSPPTDNKYHHETTDSHTLIKLKDLFTILEWRLFVQVTATDIRTLPYSAEADLLGRGWYFAKSSTDLSPSEIVYSLPWGIFRIPLATQWVVVYGNSDELAPAKFIFDKTSADGSMTEQESVRKQVQTDFPVINVVNRIYEDEVDLPAADATSPPIQHFTTDRVRDALNLGPHFLSLSGHGSQGGCCGLNTAMAQGASNSFHLSITYAMSCLTADFGSEDAMCEELLQNASGGAVAYVGYTRFGWIGAGDDYEREFFKRLKTTNHLALLNDSRFNITYSSGAWRWHHFVQVLLGDPEMPVWVGKPMAMKVTHPGTIKKAPQDVVIKVKTNTNTALTDAVVSLSMEKWVKTGITDASGTASIHIDPSTTGTLEVIVTATNRVPYFGSILVKAGIVCRSNIICRTDVLCRNRVSCHPSVTCGQLVSCGAAVLCGARLDPCRAAIACGPVIGGCGVGINIGCPNITPIPFDNLVDLFKECRVRDIRELAAKRNTPHVKEVLDRLSPASRKALEMMLKRIDNE